MYFVGLVKGNNPLVRAMEGASIEKYSFLFKWHNRAAGNRVYRLVQEGDRVVEANLTPLLPSFMPCFPAQMSLLGWPQPCLNSGSRPSSKIHATEVPTYSKLSCHYFRGPVHILCHLSTGSQQNTEPAGTTACFLFWTRGFPEVPSTPSHPVALGSWCAVQTQPCLAPSPSQRLASCGVWRRWQENGEWQQDQQRERSLKAWCALSIFDGKIAPAFGLPPHGVLAGSWAVDLGIQKRRCSWNGFSWFPCLSLSPSL